MKLKKANIYNKIGQDFSFAYTKSNAFAFLFFKNSLRKSLYYFMSIGKYDEIDLDAV